MARKRPPLHLLQLFEAAGRNMSFKKAGEELHITPSAISHQIKSLEEYLGVALFQRLTRGVKLTSAGLYYLQVVQELFQKLDHGTTVLKQNYTTPNLRISTLPSIARNIIIPNLSDFQQGNPNTKLRIETSMNSVDLRYDEFDLAIRFGKGTWVGAETEKLFNVEVTPVCSPEFLQAHPMTSINDIHHVPLIYLTNFENSWKSWCDEIGIKNEVSTTSLAFSSYEATIQAAEQGIGLALAVIPLEYNAFTKGTLVRPFAEKSRFMYDCYAVYRNSDKNRSDIAAFLNWFKQLTAQRTEI
ncbi:LysR substrate-binding domain-containing protein [Alteromonadaceae bacterium BrNp21-10]|nr:LysR substrate-binding domain-containing protein [Alteromonadaceae bacterium BrNp21-10]